MPMPHASTDAASNGAGMPRRAVTGGRSGRTRLHGLIATAVDRLLPGRRVRRAFRSQAEACETLGSPFTALLCRLAADRVRRSEPIGARLLAWPGHPGSDALALRFAGALNALVLAGRAPYLAAHYPPNPMPVPDALWAAIAKAMNEERSFIDATLGHPPQTNEVGRSAVLLGGFLTVAAATGRPLFLSELGASAGLNLFWDRFAYTIGDAAWGDPQAAVHLAPRWTGPLPPLETPVGIAGRGGCDLAPLDAASEADRQRLLAYVWPDQPARIIRLRGALGIAAAARPDIVRADAAEWLDARLAQQPAGTAHVVHHTIVWQYLPTATRSHIAAALADAGAAATAERPLAWLRLEADGKDPGAALTLTLWPEGRTRLLARADYHGRWVQWSG